MDRFGCYQEKIPAERRRAVERHFGCMRVVAALITNKRGNCGKYADGFNVLACARSCQTCWMCDDGGEKGLNSSSPFALCAVGFAKMHYLITDGDIKKGEIFSLAIEDPTKAHGLMNSKMTILLENEARKLGESKYG